MGALDAAERLARIGVSGLLSFGLAGGLDPALAPGDLPVPRTVLEGDAVFETDPALRARLGPGAEAPLLGAQGVISGAGYKAILFQATGACAVDLESGAVARVAARHGLPFAVLRAVCDPAERTLPPAALVGARRAGRHGARAGAAPRCCASRANFRRCCDLARDAGRARE